MAKIALDCDGVLANFIKAFVEEANTLFPGRFLNPGEYAANEHKTWDFPPDLLSKAETNKVWEKIKRTTDWWLKLDAFSDNVGALAVFFYTHKHDDIYIVTSRVETEGHSVAWQTERWLMACGVSPMHNYLGVIMCPNSDHKVELYDYMGIEASIDDRAETVEICDHLPNHRAYLLDRPWNVTANVKHRVPTVAQYLKEVAP